ncbi:hypothetical protein [Epilithonimonas sp.]|uniref:hypothetical protein n=1 Tax=Epilithonimonas sp. TaxID=2894511 RepID=UPI0035AEE179
MLKINAVKINIVTNKGLFGTPTIPFLDGLNIIRGNNSTGKSTIFQSVLYGLGLEELIGGKNEKTMQSVLKSEILNDDNEIEATVLESHILLEITGIETVTIKRFITSENKKAGLVEVFLGGLLSNPNSQFDYKPMYVHDPNSAKENNPFGFHPFLEKLIGWNLPEVLYKDGQYRKLYLQNIFPAFVIEQKAGWTDFLASIPYYSLNDKETRAVEFLLKFDSAERRRKKASIRQEKSTIENEWQNLYNKLQSFANTIASEVKGIDEKPSVSLFPTSIYLTYTNNEKTFVLSEYVNELQKEYDEIVNIEIPTIGEVAAEKEIEIKNLADKLGTLSVNLNATLNHKNLESERYKSFTEQLKELENDLEQNKYHKKVKEKGAELGYEIARDSCPYCEQKLDDSLLPKDIPQMPMQIDDNINYLQAQISLIKIYINNHVQEIENLERRISMLNHDISETRTQIRVLKTQLVSDNRLPSYELIEKQIRLRNRLELYSRKLEELPMFQEQFMTLSHTWQKLLSDEKELSYDLSQLDNKKIIDLENIFKQLLVDFNYRSKSIKDIHISRETYLPVVDRYSLKFDSSASDFIRAIWSYTLAVKEVSNMFNCNHPNLIILDEPGTQETANNDLRLLLEKLGNSTGTQSLVFCSFKQSETTYRECTENVIFNLIDLGTGKYIKQIES